MRPNSLPNRTSVSSSRPRCSRSASNAEAGRSTIADWLINPWCRLLWWSQPLWQISTKRTPASLSRGAVITSRHEGGAIVDRAAEVRRRVDRDVAGQVVVLGPQAIEQPRPHRRPGDLGLGRAGVQLDHRLRMRRRIGVQPANEAKLID